MSGEGFKAPSGGRRIGWAGFKIHALPDCSSQTFAAAASHLLRKGAIQTFKKILHDEGITTFWKDNVPAELLYVTYGSIQFSFCRFSTQIFSPPSFPTSAESFISGAVADAVATTRTYPFDLLRTRFVAPGPKKFFVSLRGSIFTIAGNEGFVGFFQGLGAGVGQAVPDMGLLFSAYETLRPPLSHLSLPFRSGDALAGIMAGVIAKTGLIRKRL